MKKKILSVLLAFMMVFTLMPGKISADSGSPSEGFPDATVEPESAGSVDFTKPSYGSYLATANDGYKFDHWEYVYNGTTYKNVTSNPFKCGSGNTSVKAVFVEYTSVTSVELNKSSTTIKAGDNETLTATVKPDNAANKTVTWTSSDTNVATVADGVVTGVKAGTATNGTTDTSDDKTATCSVTVSVDHTHNDITFTAWTATDSLPTEAGSYYLANDVTISSTWDVPSGTTNLCLNGKTITFSGTLGSVIKIENGNTLNLYDCGSNGTITGGKATYGGGVNVNSGTFNMYGGTISNNNATSDGGGVYINSGTFNMYGGTITNNTAGQYGGGVAFNTTGVTLYLSGSPVITGNTVNSNSYNVDYYKTKINVGTLTSGANIGVYLASSTNYVFTNGYGDNNKDSSGNIIAPSTYFSSDDGNYAIILEGNEAMFVQSSSEHTHDSITFTAWTATDSLPTAEGSYYLANDVTLSSTWSVPSGTTNLCLNGKTITLNNYQGSVIEIGSGNTLNLYDCADTSGTITGGNATKENTAYRGGGVRVLSGGTFNMYNGTISGNSAYQGGGVHNDGTFNMSGGTISNNNTTEHGGGIFNGSNAPFTMSGGTISNNTSAQNGGGVFNNATTGSAAVTISGGTITNNTATGLGGGVYNNSSGDLKRIISLSGGKITGNNGSNVYLTSTETIDVTGELSTGTSVGITMASIGVFTNSTTVDYNDASKFSSDNSSYVVGKKTNGQLFIGTSASVTSVELDKSSTTIEAGKTETLTATVKPDNATDGTVTWTSSDTSVATVVDGVVTGVAAGTATITATATNGTTDTSDDKTATCEVTVKEYITITYKSNDSVFNTQKMEKGVETELSTNTPSVSGKVFKYWLNMDSQSGVSPLYYAGRKYSFNDDITLTAAFSDKASGSDGIKAVVDDNGTNKVYLVYNGALQTVYFYTIQDGNTYTQSRRDYTVDGIKYRFFKFDETALGAIDWYVDYTDLIAQGSDVGSYQTPVSGDEWYQFVIFSKEPGKAAAIAPGTLYITARPIMVTTADVDVKYGETIPTTDNTISKVYVDADGKYAATGTEVTDSGIVDGQTITFKDKTATTVGKDQQNTYELVAGDKTDLTNYNVAYESIGKLNVYYEITYDANGGTNAP